MMGFEDYAKVKDNYCICYFGYSDEYLVQLRLIKPLLEKRFPGLNICFGCKDDKKHLLKGCEPILEVSKIKVSKKGFAHIREVRCNNQTHPIEDLLDECGIKNSVIVKKNQPRLTSKCVIITKGNYPTRDLETREIQTLKIVAREDGFDIDVDGDIADASLVMGVESIGLFEAAARGVATQLVPTGLGTRLYKLLFPNGIVRHR